MLHTPGQPRKGYEHIDTFLAVASKHLNAVDAVLLTRRAPTRPTADQLVHDYLHAAKELELALAHVKAREYGSVFEAARPGSAVWSDVGDRRWRRSGARVRARRGCSAARMDASALTALADRLHAAERAAPSRPHPYAPHTGFPGLVARKVLHAVDSFWDAAEGRMVPEPARPPHKAPGKVTQYFLADPRFDEDHPPPGTRQPGVAPGAARRSAGQPGRRARRGRARPDQPQTSSASSTSSASLAFSWSTLSELPSKVEEKPHCGRDADLVEVDVLRRLVEAGLEGVLGLQLAVLGGHEAEDDELVRRARGAAARRCRSARRRTP